MKRLILMLSIIIMGTFVSLNAKEQTNDVIFNKEITLNLTKQKVEEHFQNFLGINLRDYVDIYTWDNVNKTSFSFNVSDCNVKFKNLPKDFKVKCYIHFYENKVDLKVTILKIPLYKAL